MMDENGFKSKDTSESTSSLLILLNNENDDNDATFNTEKQQLKLQIDILIETYLNKTTKSMIDSSETSSNSSSTSISSSNDEIFIQNLFDLLFKTRYKGEFLVSFTARLFLFVFLIHFRPFQTHPSRSQH